MSFDPLEYSETTLLPLLGMIHQSVEAEGKTDEAAFFGRIIAGLEAARDPTDLAEPFMELSMSAFMGFEFSTPVAMLLDELLMHASQLSTVLSIDEDEVH